MTSTAAEDPGQRDDNKQPNYSLSEAGKTTSAAAALAAIAPHLKEAALRLATYFAAEAEKAPDHTISPSTRELSAKTGLVPSSLNRAISQLCDPKANFVTARRGSATRPTRYQINFLSTVRGASFREAPPKEAPPKTELLFEQQGASFGEAPHTENTGNSTSAARLDSEPRLTPILDRVLKSRPANFDKAEIRKAREWLHGYMVKVGNDPDAHPPDDFITAQFLSLADWPRLEALLRELFAERHRPEISYGWFITIGLQRIHNIHWTQTKAARDALRVVRRGKQPEPEQETFAQDLIAEATQKVKGIR